MVKELLNHNANIEATDLDGSTPLICGIFLNYFFNFNYFYFKASTRGHIEVVKELLSRNADIEAKDTFGSTPLIRGIFLDYNIHLNCLLFIIYSF